MQQAVELLERESQLIEIVRLVGAESIGPNERMTLETAKSIREDFLHQNAFHKSIPTPHRQAVRYDLADTAFPSAGSDSHRKRRGSADIFKLSVREDIARCKYIDYAEKEKIHAIKDKIDQQIKSLYGGSAVESAASIQ